MGKLTPDEIARLDDAIRRLYPVTVAREIGAMFGVRRHYVCKRARALGVKHTPEFLHALAVEAGKVGGSSVTAEGWKKIAARRRAVIKTERLRVLGGEPQRTRLPLAKLPEKTYHAKYNLIRADGYTATDDPWTLMRPERPKPRVRESYYVSKYKLRFIDYDNGNDRDGDGEAADMVG